jgi:ribosomal protein S18 acetylase RimI-like enzyme
MTTPSVQLELLDLRHFGARQMQPLLMEESAAWRDRLLWDYSQSTRLLLDYIDGRILPGFVALDHGRVRGYSFAVYEANKAILGDVFAGEVFADDGTTNTDMEPTAAEVEEQLLMHMLPMLQHSPGVERVESQLLLQASPGHTKTFQDAGFKIYPRLFMLCDIAALKENARQRGASAVPAGYAMRPWRQGDLAPISELIVRSYHGHTDGLINSQYNSVQGAMRFLHNIVQFPGCGTFDAAASWVIANQDSGVLAGASLCSIVSPEAAHITQLCMAPELRRAGLATLLMAQCADVLEHEHVRYVTLTVTEANVGAVQLYRELGFQMHHRFEAMVWTK